jgi:hypothetical protein
MRLYLIKVRSLLEKQRRGNQVLNSFILCLSRLIRVDFWWSSYWVGKLVEMSCYGHLSDLIIQ